MIITVNPPSGAIGRAGELRVRSELILRGFSTAVFDYDHGTDIILEDGKKIGVKAVLRPYYAKTAHSSRYTVQFGKVYQRVEKGELKRNYRYRNYDGLVDYWIIWLIQDDYFFIIPRAEVGEKMSIVVETPDELRTNAKFANYKSRSRFEQYKNNWEQLR